MLGQVIVVELGLESWSSALSIARNNLPKDAAVRPGSSEFTNSVLI